MRPSVASWSVRMVPAQARPPVAQWIRATDFGLADAERCAPCVAMRAELDKLSAVTWLGVARGLQEPPTEEAPQARGTMSRYVVDRPGLAKPILEQKS